MSHLQMLMRYQTLPFSFEFMLSHSIKYRMDVVRTPERGCRCDVVMSLITYPYLIQLPKLARFNDVFKRLIAG